VTAPSPAAFYGWRIVSASFVILFITVGIGLYSPPVFLVPLQEHFGWSRAAIAAGGSIAAVVSGIASPLIGAWLDRYGARRVMLFGAVVMGCGLGLLSLIQSLWQLYAINALTALGLCCVAWVPNQTLVANWFSRKRGLAMGIALAGIGFGGLAMSPLSALLIERLGWRLAYLGLTSLVMLIVVGVVAVVVRSKPADLGQCPDGAPPERPDPEGTDPTASVAARPGGGAPIGSALEAFRSRPFWILSLCNALTVFATLSIVAHLVAFLRDAGFQSQLAAASLGLMVGASVGGRVLFGVLADRYPKPRVMSLALILAAAGTLLLFGVHAGGVLPGFVIAFGLAFGGTAVLVPLLVGECFGLASFGKILGALMVSATVGAATGPVLTGWIFDVTGSYRMAFALHVAALTASALAILFVRVPQGTDAPASGAA
jgi:MFS family permease